MRLLLQHRTHYGYDRPAALGPHTVRLRPATHAKAKIETYALHVAQPCGLRWQEDPAGNHVARVTFEAGERVTAFDLLVEMAIDIRPVNPFDFFVDTRCDKMPFEYPSEIARDLAPYLDRSDPAYAMGPLFEEFVSRVPRVVKTIDQTVALNQAVNERLRYVIREESGVWTPEQTLAEGRGSCRDSAVLLVAALRSFGLAARFASGYLVQLTDEGMIPDQPRGVARDVVDLHAWAEVYLPGAGWVGLDATSGLLCGEGHIPLACAARPGAASPTDGTSDVPAKEVTFEMKVGRLGHEPRPTAPFPEETWTELLAAGDRADAVLSEHGVELTVGGEPTFTSRLHPEAPEWNGEALGDTKWEQGVALTEALRERVAPGGVDPASLWEALSWRELTAMGARHPGATRRRAAREEPAIDRARAVVRRRRAALDRGARGEARRREGACPPGVRRSVASAARRGTAAGRRRSASRRSPRQRGATEAGAVARSRPRHGGRLRSPALQRRWALVRSQVDVPTRASLRRARRQPDRTASSARLHRRRAPSRSGGRSVRRAPRSAPRRSRRGGEAGEGPGCRGEERAAPRRPNRPLRRATRGATLCLPATAPERCALPGAGPGDRRYIG